MRNWFLFILLLPALSSAQPDSLDIKIGQMIIMGLDNFNTLDKNQPMLKDIESGMLGNIIIYGKHINKRQPEKSLREITHYIQKIAPIPVFIGIDEEGGKVNRLKPDLGFPKTRSAQYLGKIDREDSTRFYARMSAKAMIEVGINMNFAPTVDLNTNPTNPVIAAKERSYSADMKQVAKHADWVIDEQKKQGIVNVIKHFPGHGSSASDTHLDMADVSDTWKIAELYPYKALIDQKKVQVVMTAHIVNERLDASRVPATLSADVIKGILRDFLGYDGVVVSDDMQMHAISKHYGFEEALVMSINAGVDMVMIANNTDLAQLITAAQVHWIIKQKVKDGSIPMSRINESYKRIMRLKASIK